MTLDNPPKNMIGLIGENKIIEIEWKFMGNSELSIIDEYAEKAALSSD
jgi:hypothetical protein